MDVRCIHNNQDDGNGMLGWLPKDNTCGQMKCDTGLEQLGKGSPELSDSWKMN